MKRPRCERCGKVRKVIKPPMARGKKLCERCFNKVRRENKDLHNKGKNIPDKI